MTLQEQVCTLEQAQRLKELGCKQESYFAWVEGHSVNDYSSVVWELWSTERAQRYNRGQYTLAKPQATIVPAYTVAELGEMLAAAGMNGFPSLIGSSARLEWAHELLREQYSHKRIVFKTEAQARAALLIHRLEKEKEA